MVQNDLNNVNLLNTFKIFGLFPTYLKFEQRRQHLLQNGSNVLQRQGTEFILFEKIVKILLEHLEDQAGVVFVLEALECSYKVKLICILLA